MNIEQTHSDILETATEFYLNMHLFDAWKDTQSDFESALELTKRTEDFFSQDEIDTIPLQIRAFVIVQSFKGDYDKIRRALEKVS